MYAADSVAEVERRASLEFSSVSRITFCYPVFRVLHRELLTCMLDCLFICSSLPLYCVCVCVCVFLFF